MQRNSHRAITLPYLITKNIINSIAVRIKKLITKLLGWLYGNIELVFKYFY